MPAASKAYPWQLVLINGWPIDCTRSEVHMFDSEVTEFPVESGSVITDNVRLLPMRVDLDCVVSNTPFGEAAQNVNAQFGVSDNDPRLVGNETAADFAQPLNALRSSVAYERMMMIRNAREPVTIRTSRGKFENMILKTINIPRDNQTGDAMVFSANFQQVVIVNNVRGKRVAIPIATGTGGGGGFKVVKQNWTRTPDELPMTRARDNAGNWFDPDIRAWRKFWTLNLATGEIVYHKGPMFDGFAGTDAAMREHIIKTYGGPNNAFDADAAVPSSVRRHQEQQIGATVDSGQAFGTTNEFNSNADPVFRSTGAGRQTTFTNPARDFGPADPTIVGAPVQGGESGSLLRTGFTRR